jgi:hypothetical protein
MAVSFQEAKGITTEELLIRSIAAQRIEDGKQLMQEAISSTERRLAAYPYLKLRVEYCRERIQEIQDVGAPNKCRSVIENRKPTAIYLTPKEASDRWIQFYESEIAETEFEIDTIEKALATIDGEPYREIIRLKYFEKKSVSEIAAFFSCDTATFWRQKAKLISILAAFLYGVAVST